MEDDITTHFFEFLKEQNTDGKKTITRKCKVCCREYRGYRNMNSNFVIHLKHVHKPEYDDYIKNFSKNKSQISWQQSQVSTWRSSRSEHSADTIALKRKLLKFEKMLLSTGINLDIINNKYFKDFLHELDSKFHIPHIDVLKRDITLHYNLLKINIQNLLKEAVVIVTSFDLWVSKSMVTYLSVSAHLMTKEWTYEHRLLSLKRIFGIATEATIIYEYESILNKFDINNNVFINLASNAANLLKILQLKFVTPDTVDIKLPAYEFWSYDDDFSYDEFLDVNSLLNIDAVKINNIVNKNESFIFMLLVVIKESIQNVPILMITLQSCSKIISYIYLSHMSKEDFKYKTFLTLKQCIETKQISYIHMYQHFFKSYEDISKFLSSTGFECLLLTDEQCEILKEFLVIMQPFQEALDFLFVDAPGSISKCLPTIIALRRHLQILTSVHLTSLAELLFAKLDNHFQNIYEDSVHIISTLLHPAWKMIPFIHIDMHTKAKQVLIDELRTNEQSHGGECKSEIMDLISSKIANLDDQSSDSGESLSKKTRLSELFQVFKSNSQKFLPGYEIELESYLKDEQIEEDANPLTFWMINESKYPQLSSLAKKYLTVPAISLPIEKIKLLTNDIIKDSSNFTPENLFSKLYFLKYNLDLF